jgi:hypothetical protein
VAHPLMLRAIAAAKRKNDKIDAAKIADCLRCDFLPECLCHAPIMLPKVVIAKEMCRGYAFPQ